MKRWFKLIGITILIFLGFYVAAKILDAVKERMRRECSKMEESARKRPINSVGRASFFMRWGLRFESSIGQFKTHCGGLRKNIIIARKTPSGTLNAEKIIWVPHSEIH